MATKKKSSIEAAAIAAETETEEKEWDPWEKVKIKLPRSNEGDLFVRVNDYTALIKRGVVVEIPRCAAEVIANSINQDEETYARIDALTAKADY